MADRFEPDELGRTIQKLRDQQGWSQQELAKRSGVSQGQISTLERGEGNPSITILDQISKALGVPTWVLVAGLALFGLAVMVAVAEENQQK
jgi:XRE family transcriptional regulator, regulator of sulfur utilization